MTKGRAFTDRAQHYDELLTNLFWQCRNEPVNRPARIRDTNLQLTRTRSPVQSLEGQIQPVENSKNCMRSHAK